MDDQKLKRFVELEARKCELEEEVKRVASERAALEEALLGEFERAGIQSVRMNGSTIFLHRQLWAKAKDGDYARACAALEESGLGVMVEPRFNTNTLSSWVREEEKDGRELPEALRQAIEVSERFSIRTRKD